LLNPDFPSYNFDVIDGVEYQIDLTQPARFAGDGTLANPDAHRITDLSFQGEPIDPEDQFIVATNNYRASGGGSFPGLDGSNVVIEAPDENRTILGNYILELGTIDPSADGNWSFKPIEGDVTVTFASAPEAEGAITPEMGIARVGEDEAGFGVYEIAVD
jgi:2',3'-cyclic-nucleotide 2'-phosphodiesterase/3'-nucleotidase